MGLKTWNPIAADLIIKRFLFQHMVGANLL
jgi:hypothetical protein